MVIKLFWYFPKDTNVIMDVDDTRQQVRNVVHPHLIHIVAHLDAKMRNLYLTLLVLKMVSRELTLSRWMHQKQLFASSLEKTVTLLRQSEISSNVDTL